MRNSDDFKEFRHKCVSELCAVIREDLRRGTERSHVLQERVYASLGCRVLCWIQTDPPREAVDDNQDITVTPSSAGKGPIVSTSNRSMGSYTAVVNGMV